MHPQSSKLTTTAKPHTTNHPTIQGSSVIPLSTLSTKKMRTPRTRTATPAPRARSCSAGSTPSACSRGRRRPERRAAGPRVHASSGNRPASRQGAGQSSGVFFLKKKMMLITPLIARIGMRRHHFPKKKKKKIKKKKKKNSGSG
jgi:hypothetical protein